MALWKVPLLHTQWGPRLKSTQGEANLSCDFPVKIIVRMAGHDCLLPRSFKFLINFQESTAVHSVQPLLQEQLHNFYCKNQLSLVHNTWLQWCILWQLKFLLFGMCPVWISAITQTVLIYFVVFSVLQIKLSQNSFQPHAMQLIIH